MKLYNFLPQKYKEMKLRKNRKVILIIIINFILLNTFISVILYNNIRKLDRLMTKSSKTSIFKPSAKDKPVKNLLTLSSLIKFGNLGIKYKKINIDGNIINIDIIIDDVNGCLKIVKDLESKKDYKITTISPIKKDGEKYILNLQLEVLK